MYVSTTSATLLKSSLAIYLDPVVDINYIHIFSFTQNNKIKGEHLLDSVLELNRDLKEQSHRINY